MAPLNSNLVAAFQKHLVPAFASQTEYEPWWWPASPGRNASDWGLGPSQLLEYRSLNRGAAKITARSRKYGGFAGSVAAQRGAAWLLSIRPFAGTYARSVGPLYTAMCNHANRYDGSVVPELHVTDLVKFRGPTAVASWTVGLTDTMLRASIECLYEEYLAIAPPIILLVDWAGLALSDRESPLCKTSALRLSWRSDPSSAHLDSLLSKIAQTGRPVPFWGQGNQAQFMGAFSAGLHGYVKGRARRP
jgi:hypothetical protein